MSQLSGGSASLSGGTAPAAPSSTPISLEIRSCARPEAPDAARSCDLHSGSERAASGRVRNFEIDPDGSFVHWPDIDVHLGWNQLLQAVDPGELRKALQRTEGFNERYGAAIRRSARGREYRSRRSRGSPSGNSVASSKASVGPRVPHRYVGERPRHGYEYLYGEAGEGDEVSGLPPMPNTDSAKRTARGQRSARQACCCCIRRIRRSRSRARGSPRAFADILIDMQMPPGDRFTRRRHFSGVGRYPGPLQHVAAELNPEETDYRVLADRAPEAASPQRVTRCGRNPRSRAPRR